MEVCRFSLFFITAAAAAVTVEEQASVRRRSIQGWVAIILSWKTFFAFMLPFNAVVVVV